VSRHDDDIAIDTSGDDFELFPVIDSSYSDDQCDSCTCCTRHGCAPSICGEDDYGRFHCPCTSE
jgi:Rieske Fe-S protein